MILSEVTALSQIGFPILSLLIFLPLLAGIAIAYMRDAALAQKVALVISVVELALAILVWVRFDASTANMQFVERIALLPSVGISYHVGIDGISVLFLPATALLTLLVVLYGESTGRGDVNKYLGAILAFEATMMGAFSALDLALFWAFFVAELIPSYMLLVNWGTGERRREAASNYLTFMLAGSVSMLIGFIMLAGHGGQQTGGGFSFDYVQLLNTSIPLHTQVAVFFLIVFGLAIKAPLFPFHTWLPKVLEQGPIIGMSVFVVGVKLGTYGLLRFVLPLLPEASREWAWLMLTVGVAGMVYGALIALVQTNLRRLLAFASLSHMGVVVIAIFSLKFAGFQGGLLQMLNLGIVGAGLFFIAGFLHTRVGAADLTVRGGISNSAPLLGLAFLIIGMAGIGMPGTSGFNGEHLVMIGAYHVHWGLALISGFGVVLTASYFFWFYQRAFMAVGVGGAPGDMPDLRPCEKFIAGTLCAVIFWVGLHTTPFLTTMEAPLAAIEKRLEKGSNERFTPAPAKGRVH